VEVLGQMNRRVVLFTLIILSIGFVSSCSYKLKNIEKGPLPTKLDGSKHSKEEVRNAIVKACVLRGWIPQLQEDGTIRASIFVRGARAEVDIQYDESTVSILFRDRERCSYKYYNRWVNNLYQTIVKQLVSSFHTTIHVYLPESTTEKKIESIANSEPQSIKF
jgi:hypothetical protein